MNRQLLVRLSLDLVMVVLILLSFAYQLTGNMLHELIGFVLLFLAIVHNLLNWRWYAALLKGKYNARRLIGGMVNSLLLAISVLLFMSGIMNSDVLSFVNKTDESVFTRQFHAWAAYWILILASVHLGMHWKMVMAEIRKMVRMTGTSRIGAIVLRIMAVTIVAFGVDASFNRNMFSKLTAAYSFDYWDFDSSVMGFFGEYLSIMGIYVCLTYYSLKLLRKKG